MPLDFVNDTQDDGVDEILPTPDDESLVFEVIGDGAALMRNGKKWTRQAWKAGP